MATAGCELKVKWLKQSLFIQNCRGKAKQADGFGKYKQVVGGRSPKRESISFSLHFLLYLHLLLNSWFVYFSIEEWWEFVARWCHRYAGGFSRRSRDSLCRTFIRFGSFRRDQRLLLRCCLTLMSAHYPSSSILSLLFLLHVIKKNKKKITNGIQELARLVSGFKEKIVIFI